MMTTRSQQRLEYCSQACSEQTKNNEKINIEKILTKDKTTNIQDGKTKVNKPTLNLKHYFQQGQAQNSSHDKNKMNTYSSSIFQNPLLEKDCFKIEFNRVCQDQPNLISQCCWICLDLSSQCMYQCRQCDMYLCASCNQLSALNKKCFNCSSLNSVRPIAEKKCLILKAAVFSCRFNKQGCPVSLDSNQLQNHEKICEFSAQNASKEQSYKKEENEQQKSKFKRNEANKLDRTVLIEVKEEENDGDDDEEEDKKKRSSKDKLSLQRKKPISKSKTSFVNNIKKERK